MKLFKYSLAILLLIMGYSIFAQKSEKQKTKDSLTECLTLEEILKQVEGRDKRLDAKNNTSNSDNEVMFSEDYNSLLTLELASGVTGFDPSKARKTHTLKGMTGEILRYNWENGREEIKEKSASNRKRKLSLKTDIVQIKYVDFEADMDSFLDFIGLEDHPELSKKNGIGESAYWNSKQNHLEVYAKGISFTLEVDISDDDTFDKEKTIALAKLIVKERIK
ncbi:MAG: hypothetical protein ACSHXF_00705 [Aquaticitalea sp.]